jgi:hypothetical protein
MPNERYFEILLSRAVPIVFGDHFFLIAQQLTLPSGRVDLLLQDKDGAKHILEIKKDQAKPEAVSQVMRYVADFKQISNAPVFGWVVANDIPELTKRFAEQHGIRCRAVPFGQYDAIMQKAGLTEAELMGERVQQGILMGGGVQQFKANGVTFEEAASQLPEPTQAFVRRLAEVEYLSFSCGKMQMAIMFKGIKMGGFNRSHRHVFISSNIVLDVHDEDVLKANGFAMIRKTQESSSHMHVYWKAGLSQVARTQRVIEHFCRSIDRRLFGIS